MKKVVCFSRVSSSAQDLTNQRNEVLKVIKNDNFKTSEIVMVEGKESAIKLDEMERQTLNELKEVIDTNPTITDVYFYAIDRLARKVSVVLSIVDQMTAKGINLHFLNPYPMQTMRNGKEDAMGKMFLTFLSIGAEMEMKMKSHRFADTRKGMREKGQLIGGSVLYGYYRDKSGYPMKKDEESKVVEDIFNWYVIDGLSMRQIAKRLVCDNVWSVEGFKTLNSAVMKVSKIITNPAYSGRQAKQYDSKEEKTVIYPAIVDAELQDKAIQIASNNHKEKDTKNIYYAKGLVKTEVDGKYYVMSPVKGDSSYSLSYDGLRVGVSINVIDTIAWRNTQTLYRIYQTYENFAEPQRLEDYIKLNEEKIQKLQPIFEEFAQREDRVNELYEMGRYSVEKYNMKYEEITKEKQQYLNEQIKLENENKRLRKQIQNMMTMKTVELDTTTLSDEDKRDLVKEMINEIQVEKVGKYEYNIVIKPNEALFKIGIVIPSYNYNCSGGVKRLTEKVALKEVDISNEIEIRYKIPKR